MMTKLDDGYPVGWYINGDPDRKDRSMLTKTYLLLASWRIYDEQC